jgi:hypothetical protein
MATNAINLTVLQQRIRAVIADRPAGKLTDFGYRRGEGLPGVWMGFAPEFLYDRYTTELVHPSKVTSEFVWEHLAKLDFALELPPEVWAYYLPALLLAYPEAVGGTTVAHEIFRSTFETSVLAKDCNLSKLPAEELALLRDVIDFVDQSYVGFYSRKRHSRLLKAVDRALTAALQSPH